MGKRGPQPKGPYSNRTASFSSRLREDTRAMLDEAAKNSRRSISQEVEVRLRDSFEQEDIRKTLYVELVRIRMDQQMLISMIATLTDQLKERKHEPETKEQPETKVRTDRPAG